MATPRNKIAAGLLKASQKLAAKGLGNRYTEVYHKEVGADDSTFALISPNPIVKVYEKEIEILKGQNRTLMNRSDVKLQINLSLFDMAELQNSEFRINGDVYEVVNIQAKEGAYYWTVFLNKKLHLEELTLIPVATDPFYNTLAEAVIDCGILGDSVEKTYDCGILGDPVEKTYDCGLLGDPLGVVSTIMATVFRRVEQQVSNTGVEFVSDAQLLTKDAVNLGDRVELDGRQREIRALREITNIYTGDFIQYEAVL